MSIRRVISLLILLLNSFVLFAQGDSAGSGRAISFDGIDDYVDFGDRYNDLNLPFTVSAWVFLDPGLDFPAPIFVTNDVFDGSGNNYRGFWFFISELNLWCEYGDGSGGNNPAFRRGKTASVQSFNIAGRWVHLCAVMNSGFNFTLYVNGNNIGGVASGTSNLPMASSYVGDHAKAGSFVTNDGLTYKMKGMIDEIRLWNRALSESEIRSTMCKKLSGNEPGLIGNWNFDEVAGNTVGDKSSNGFNGQLMNNPTRVYSGAPIGDESTFLYQSNWSGVELLMSGGNEQVKVKNITGNPEGVHIYSVKNLPSQTQGLDLSLVSDQYFGVYMAAKDVGNLFDVSYNSNGNESCGILARPDNSVASWSNENSPLINVIDRNEIIKKYELGSLEIDLGENEVSCPFIPRILKPLSDPSGFDFTWQDGSKQTTFQATSFGKYWVIVEKDCLIGTDTIEFIQDAAVELKIDLGNDEIVCPLTPRILKPLENPSGFEFTWQDGSKQSTFLVHDYGTYWVSIENDCTFGSDTIEISKVELNELVMPNVFTPNNADNLNEHFEIDQRILGSHLVVYNRWGKQVYESLNYKNDWDGSDLPVGVYFYRVFGPCLEEKKGYVSILR